MPPQFCSFCIWIWLFTLLYWFDVITYSSLYLSIPPVITIIPYNFLNKYNKRPLYKKISIILIEFTIATMNVYKHFKIDKKKLIEKDDIIFSILIFGAYLLFLYSMNINFYKLY